MVDVTLAVTWNHYRLPHNRLTLVALWRPSSASLLRPCDIAPCFLFVGPHDLHQEHQHLGKDRAGSWEKVLTKDFEVNLSPPIAPFRVSYHGPLLVPQRSSARVDSALSKRR